MLLSFSFLICNRGGVLYSIPPNQKIETLNVDLKNSVTWGELKVTIDSHSSQGEPHPLALELSFVWFIWKGYCHAPVACQGPQVLPPTLGLGPSTPG